jgi:F420-dependent oxidoreductase-like protein
MKVGLHLSYWGLGPGPEEQLAASLLAEDIGIDSVWVGEAYGSDAFSVLSWLAAKTSTIGLGTAIAQMPARQPTALAMSAATVDVLAEGRLTVGLGPSGPQVAEGWYGQPFAQQLTRTREYIDVVRMALAREPVAYDGSIQQLPRPGGVGKPLHLMIRPVQERIPLCLAAIGPKATALAGEIADGWMPIFFSPEHVEVLLPSLREGADVAGRSSTDVRILPTVPVGIHADVDVARDLVRDQVALYIGGMGAKGKNFYTDLAVRYGFDEALVVQDLYLSGRKEAAKAALSVALLDAVAVCGPVDRVRARLADYEAVGVDTILASIAARDPEDRLRQVRALARAAGL